VSETRKIAAILVADIVGYSRLAGTDEDRTLARLRGLRSDLIDPAIDAHHGRIVKRTGDGSLIEFRSVVDAVRCAIEVQNGLVERNVGVPAERRIEFRVGIHLGDVVEEADGDLMGDGVNIAARLEGVCEPGGICLSEDAYRQVRDKLKEEFADLGNKELRNIARPVRAYALQIGGRSATSASPSTTKAKAGPPRLSIVVLPFANLSGEEEQDYFVDGVTESLTTDLSRISGAFVIARNTAFAYKGKPADARQIGRELGVRYVLEGSVQRGGHRMRVNVQLIDAETGAHLWAERFDKPLADLFDMQDEIVARLANSLGAQLIAAEARRAERETNPDSMDLFFRGKVWLNKVVSSQNLDTALRFFEQALALDPNNAEALVGSAAVEVRKAANYLSASDRPTQLSSADAAASRAIALAPEHALAHVYKGLSDMYSGQAARGVARCERALELDRNMALAHFAMGLGKIFLGRCEDTEGHVREALSLSPRDTNAYQWLAVIGHAKVHLEKFDEAVTWLTKSVEFNGSYALARFYFAVALESLGRLRDAQAEVRAGLALEPSFTVARFRAGAWSENEIYLAQRERIYAGMRRAGVPEG